MSVFLHKRPDDRVVIALDINIQTDDPVLFTAFVPISQMADQALRFPKGLRPVQIDVSIPKI